MVADQPRTSHEPAKTLARHYNRITLGGALMLVVMVSVLFYLQFRDLRESRLQAMRAQLTDRADALDAFLTNITFYVDQLRYQAQYHLRRPDSGYAGALLAAPKDAPEGYFSLDAVPADTDAEDIGNLFGLGTYADRMDDPTRAAEVRMALSLFPLFRATHQSLPNLVQSYYQSVDHVTAIYPWTPTQDIINRSTSGNMVQVLTDVGSMEFVTLGRPHVNPEARPYWTRVYQDPAGRGLMVTHGAPVYDGDRFLGVVATDITLDAVGTFVDDMGAAGGTMWVVDGHGQVPAASDGDDDRVHAALEKLPPALRPHADTLTALQGTTTLSGFVVARAPLSSADWSLVFVLPEAELNRQSVYGIVGYVVIVLGLCLFLFLIYITLLRRFVRPALALTDHIRAEAADGKSHMADVPPIWRPWFQTVSDTFALKHVTSNLPGAVFQLRRQDAGAHQVVFVSHALRELAGINPETLMTGEAHWDDLFEPDDAARMRLAMDTSTKGLSRLHFECAMHHAAGDTHWVRFSANPRRDEDAVIWEGLILDITKRKQAEEALKASEGRLRAIMDASLFPLVVSRSRNQSVAFINHRAMDLFGLTRDDLKSADTRSHWVDLDQRAKLIDRIAGEGMVENEEVALKRKDGAPFWVLMSAIPLTYAGDDCLLFTFTDISRRKQLETELQRLATTDPLTGAANRRHFLELGERERRRALRSTDGMAVLMLDIDHFKSINDTYGHPAGDAVLCRVVACLESKIRGMDVLGRLGGEEFAVLLPDASLVRAAEVADRLREALGRLAVTHEGRCIRFTVSIGAAALEPNDSLESLMSRADQALYAAKTGGRNRVMTHA